MRTPTTRWITPLLAAVALFALLPHDASAIRIRHDTPLSVHVDLGAQEHLRAVGRVHARSMGCTGALVAPDIVLTAAHCVVRSNGSTVPARDVRFLIDRPGGGTQVVGASAIMVHPGYDRTRRRNIDLALVMLQQPVSDVRPLAITNADPRDRLATLVGYGSQGRGNDPASVTRLAGAPRKIAAQNVIDRMRNECCGVDNIMLHTDFDDPRRTRRSSLGGRTPVTLEGIVSFGDSGSPLLARYGDRDFIVGVASYIFGTGVPGDGGYGEVAGFQWAGAGSVVSWLEQAGVPVADDPFRASIFGDGAPGSSAPGASGADQNADGLVNAGDAALFLERQAAGDARADLNLDGALDVRDSAVMLEALGFTKATYPKKRAWKRAVKAAFRSGVRAQMIGLSNRDAKRAERTLLKAYRFLAR